MSDARSSEKGVPFAWMLLCIVGGASCGGPAHPASAPVASVEPAEPAEPAAAPAPAAELPPLTWVLSRDPRGDERCTRAFPRFYEWELPPDGEDAGLRRIVWLEPGHEAEAPPVSDSEALARGARCFAAGPHRGLNLRNWCCRSDREVVDVPPPDDAVGLVATLSTDRATVPSAGELQLAVAVENRGSEPAELDAYVAGVPVLFLEVRDEAGHPVPTTPPPTPPPRPEIVTLAPHGGRTFQHTLLVFAPPLPPGEYTVRVRDPSVASGALRFRVVPAAPLACAGQDREDVVPIPALGPLPSGEPVTAGVTLHCEAHQLVAMDWGPDSSARWFIPYDRATEVWQAFGRASSMDERRAIVRRFLR